MQPRPRCCFGPACQQQPAAALRRAWRHTKPRKQSTGTGGWALLLACTPEAAAGARSQTPALPTRRAAAHVGARTLRVACAPRGRCRTASAHLGAPASSALAPAAPPPRQVAARPLPRRASRRLTTCIGTSTPRHGPPTGRAHASCIRRPCPARPAGASSTARRAQRCGRTRRMWCTATCGTTTAGACGCMRRGMGRMARGMGWVATPGAWPCTHGMLAHGVHLHGLRGRPLCRMRCAHTPCRRSPCPHLPTPAHTTVVGGMRWWTAPSTCPLGASAATRCVTPHPPCCRSQSATRQAQRVCPHPRCGRHCTADRRRLAVHSG